MSTMLTDFARTRAAHLTPRSRRDACRRLAIAVVPFMFLLLASSPSWPTPQYCPATGHYYDVISALDGINWTDAEAAAEAVVWQGQHGHLATIESAEENQFVFNLSLATDIWHVSTVWYVGPWLGGFQQDGAEEPAGGWGWISGDPWGYTNWMPGQPDNNSPPENENRLVLWGEGIIAPTWNDYVDDRTASPPEDRVWGYIVEFDTPPTPVLETTWGQIKGTFH